jgi:hypothetical protein
VLDLRYSGVTSAGVQAFRAGAPLQITLSIPREFQVRKRRSSQAGGGRPSQWLESRRRGPHGGGKINRFRWQGWRFCDAKLKYLAKLRRQLNLDGTDVSDLGLETIGKLSSLRDLSLSFTSISDRGWPGLVRSERAPMLAGTQVGGSVFRSSRWTSRELDLTSAPVTNEAMPHREDDRLGGSCSATRM